jgi:hypothetical protein
MEFDIDDVVFKDSQIGRGLKPLAQHGSVVIGSDGTFTLLGTKGDVIDSAPISEVSAKRMMITGGQTVALRVQDRKYNTTPGWGASLSQWGGVLGTSSAAKALVKLVESNGRREAL